MRMKSERSWEIAIVGCRRGKCDVTSLEAIVAAEPGFEPGLRGPEPRVLPLHHSAKGILSLSPLEVGGQGEVLAPANRAPAWAIAGRTPWRDGRPLQ